MDGFIEGVPPKVYNGSHDLYVHFENAEISQVEMTPFVHYEESCKRQNTNSYRKR